MAYVRRTWVPEETRVNAGNMNNIEDGIEEALAEAALDATAKAHLVALGLEFDD